MRVLDQNGSVRNVLPSQVMNKIPQRRNAVSTDRNGSEIRCGDTVREVTGEQRTGAILHIHRSFLFLNNKDAGDNAGIIVTRASNVTTVATSGGRLASRSAPDFSRMNPAIQKNGMNGSGMPPPKSFGRDRTIGKTVTIRKGPFKGLLGIVKDTTDAQARVELHSKNKVVTVDKDMLSVKEYVATFPPAKFCAILTIHVVLSLVLRLISPDTVVEAVVEPAGAVSRTVALRLPLTGQEVEHLWLQTTPRALLHGVLLPHEVSASSPLRFKQLSTVPNISNSAGLEFRSSKRRPNPSMESRWFPHIKPLRRQPNRIWRCLIRRRPHPCLDFRDKDPIRLQLRLQRLLKLRLRCFCRWLPNASASCRRLAYTRLGARIRSSPTCWE